MRRSLIVAKLALYATTLAAAGWAFGQQLPAGSEPTPPDPDVAPIDRPGPSTDPQAGDGHEGHCRLLTIARGPVSGWGLDRPGFAGADLLIRDPHTWDAFWRVHTSIMDEPPPPPPVNFREHAVIAAIQGVQRTGGGPNITVAELGAAEGVTRVLIVDDERPGPEDHPTNPFHIVAVPRRCVPGPNSLIFTHVRPPPESGIIEGRVLGARPEGDGHPLAGALVTLRREEEVLRRTVTGLDGSFVFLNVAPGEYGLGAEARGFEPARVPIAVHPGLNRQVIVLHPTSTGAFAGRVLGAAEPGHEPTPIAGAHVRVLREGAVVAETMTDEHGFFRIRNLQPGPYGALAVAEGWRPADARIEIVAGEVTRHTFILEPR